MAINTPIPSFPPRSGWIRYITLLPWGVLAAFLLLTYLLRVQTAHDVRRDMQNEFDARARETISLVQQRMLSYEKVLYGVRGLFATSPDVSRNEFRAYFNALNLTDTHPGIQGLGFSQIVPAAQKDKHIAAIRREGFPQYTIRPEGVRDLYTSVIYIEPFSKENMPVFGYDLYSDLAHPINGDPNVGARHNAMNLARDSGKAVISSKVKLLADIRNNGYVQAGFLMYLPVYKNGAALDTLDERRANIIGWVYFPFRMDDLMAGILGGVAHDVDVEVHDGETVSEKSVMYDPDFSSVQAGRESLFHTTERIEISGHSWTVTVRSLESFEMRMDNGESQFISYSGSGASVLLALLAWLLVYGRTRALRDAGAIARSEIRLSTIIDTALDAVVQMDSRGRITGWNTRAEAIFGWSRNAAIGSLLHETIIPPAHREAHINGLSGFLKTGAGSVLNTRLEITAMHRDGHEFPIELSVTEIKIGDQYLFTSFIRDITERKRAEEALRMSEQRFRDVSDAAGEYLWEIDTDMVYTYVSNRSAEIKGHAPEELIGHTPMEFMPIEDISIFVNAVNRAIANRSTFKLQHKNIAKIGVTLWEEVTGLPILDASGNVIGLRGTGLNITQRKQTEDELRLASMVYENSSEAMVVTNAENHIIAVNPSFEKLTGYTMEEVLGKDPKVLSSGRQDHAFYRAMWNELESVGHWHGELWDKRKNGEIYPKSLSINTIRNEQGEVHRYVALFSDITKKKESEELIWRQANFDTLTGLPNRRMFHDRMDMEIKKAHRNGLQMALLLLDLDHFKEINDTLGHDMGDNLLKEAASRLSACVRESDTVARLGGDEFAIILGELEDIASIERIARDILQKLAEPFRLGNDTGYVSTSIGITLYPDDATDIEALLKNADQAMYEAKKQGRNRSSYFTQAMQETAQTRMRLINELRSAILAGDQFVLHYQPIVELASGAIHKAEALIRWQHPVRGMISPAEFIPIAEETGMIVEIGDWVFYQAAALAARWHASHKVGFQFSINKSPVQFKDANSEYKQWFEHLRELGLPGHCLTVEITEGLLMDAGSAIEEQLLAFRDAGVQVAIDDFGIGYSSLSYLKRFHIDYLKIDQSFVRDLEADPDDLALCEAIIVMAHRLGIKVIAEGIETEKQRDLLLAAGCDYGQGFLFARPLPADELDAFLDSYPG